MPTTKWKRAHWVPLLALLAIACATTVQTRSSEGLWLRGRVVSRTTGRPVADALPLAVSATHPGSARRRLLEAVTLVGTEAGLSPATVVVPVGCGVRFVNEDAVCHRYFASSEDNAFELGLLHPGDSALERFWRTGPVHVYCSLHEGKQCTLLVVPSADFSVVDEEGGFAIGDLAPGTYVLETWSETVPTQALEVTVGVGGEKEVEIRVDDTAAGRAR